MGLKPRLGRDGAFVVARAKHHAAEVHADPRVMTSRAIAELAHEAWWNVALYECENRGVDIGDESFEALFCDAFEAEIARLKSEGPEKPWQSERIATLFSSLAALPSHRREALAEFIADSELDEPDCDNVDAFCQLLEYIFGGRSELPAAWRGSELAFEIDTDCWQLLFADLAAWDDIETRLCRFIWLLPARDFELNKDFVFRQVASALTEQAERDLFGPFRALLIGLGEDDDSVLELSMDTLMLAALSGDRVTSYGRYIAALDFERVFPVVVQAKRVSYYASLLVHCAPTVFDANTAAIEQAIADSEGWKLDIAETMLARDRDKYADTVTAWAQSLTGPSMMSHMAIYLCRAFGVEQRELVLELTAKAIRGFGDDDSSAAEPVRAIAELRPYGEFPNSSVKLCLVATVLAAYGELAFDAIRDYDYRNKGWMIRFYEIVGEFLPGHRGALALLIDGLMRELPDHLGGQLTYAKYLARLVKVLANYDLAEYRSRIEQRFAGDSAALVAPLLG